MTTILRIKETAKEKGIKLSYICERLGFKSRTYFNDVEKNNREIPDDKLQIIADELNTTVAYLKGETDEKNKPASGGELTNHEKKMLDAYRNNPDMQATIDRILGIEKEGQVLLWAAAQSEDNRAPKVIYMSKERWEKIQNAPDTDDPLL